MNGRTTFVIRCIKLKSMLLYFVAWARRYQGVFPRYIPLQQHPGTIIHFIGNLLLVLLPSPLPELHKGVTNWPVQPVLTQLLLGVPEHLVCLGEGAPDNWFMVSLCVVYQDFILYMKPYSDFSKDVRERGAGGGVKLKHL